MAAGASAGPYVRDPSLFPSSAKLICLPCTSDAPVQRRSSSSASVALTVHKRSAGATSQVTDGCGAAPKTRARALSHRMSVFRVQGARLQIMQARESCLLGCTLLLARPISAQRSTARCPRIPQVAYCASFVRQGQKRAGGACRMNVARMSTYAHDVQTFLLARDSRFIIPIVRARTTRLIVCVSARGTHQPTRTERTNGFRRLLHHAAGRTLRMIVCVAPINQPGQDERTRTDENEERAITPQ
ncbi:hypothetical protein GGX14DRAFT_575097 [Mycena pura]|uniref:Uncharacterized protein n=1 Tax=Mycena pura TaxID=153505 RepID=A0AAD6UWR4_9AGAR|nr:hypothetical protein GGX14DRAFT_575097 [Mycena pura]